MAEDGTFRGSGYVPEQLSVGSIMESVVQGLAFGVADEEKI